MRQYVPPRGLPAYASRAELINALFNYVSEEEGLPPSIQQVWPPPRPLPRSVSGPGTWACYHTRILAAEWVRPAVAAAAEHRQIVINDQHGQRPAGN